jgi:hypothetical protein
MPAKRRIWKIAQNIEGLKMEGFMQNLKKEVQLMTEMVNCMDSFLRLHSRLVVIVDCLDSCEREKLLQVLDIVQMLFGEQDSPFITILAVDPHIVISGIQSQMTVRLLISSVGYLICGFPCFLQSNIRHLSVNGFDYLNNVVQLPFFLQSQALPEAPRAKMEKSESSVNDTPRHVCTIQSMPFNLFMVQLLSAR